MAYAPRRAHDPTLALLALDARLAGVLRHSREPMLAQLRLAWWRETLGQASADWPEGEPLLAALRSWNGSHGELAALVDGWEALTGTAPLPAVAIEEMARGRARAFVALARLLGRQDEIAAVEQAGIAWALADLAAHLRDPDERGAAIALAAALPPRRPRLSRALRPLAVLQALAERRLRRAGAEESFAARPADVLVALRAGLLGR